jgi:hypothetical protein
LCKNIAAMKRPENPTGNRFKTRYTCINAADAHDFSLALKEAFPNIRFVRAPYWEYFIVLGQREDGYWSHERVVNEPPNLHVPYVDTMGVEDGSRFTAWLEPEGWEPLWFGPNESGIHFIANEPRHWFMIGISHDIPFSRLPGPTTVRDERIESSYYFEDKEHLAFLNKVWRILEKLTSNVYVYYDGKTFEPKGVVTKGHTLWSGHHLRRWCLERPDRFIDFDLRPPESEPADWAKKPAKPVK